MSFAFGRALRDNPSESNNDRRYRPIESEIVAVPLAYPGRRRVSSVPTIRLPLFKDTSNVCLLDVTVREFVDF